MCGCAGQNSVTFSSLSETEGYIAGQAWQVLLSFGLHSDVAENVGSSKREIRTSLPLGNITMCIFSPPFLCLSFVVCSGRPTQTPPGAIITMPPLPSRNQFRWSRLHSRPRSVPSRLKLLCCFSVHFCISSQSGGGRIDQ